jgi:hypothetical protein
MVELFQGFVAGLVVMFLAQLAFPKVSDVIGNIHRSRALAKAKAVLAAEEARLQALAAAKAAVAAAAVAPPPAPKNPLATGPSGTTGA